jgi:hypothetical protein
MLIFNIDHLHKDFVELSQSASATLLTGASSFFEFTAALELQRLQGAAAAARKTAQIFDQTVLSFRRLAGLLEATPSAGNWTRDVEPGLAASEVHLSTDDPLVQALIEIIVGGKIHEVFLQGASDISEFSSRLKDFAGRVASGNVVLDDEYRMGHELLRSWSALMTQGQYVSSVCYLAATVRIQ